MDELAEGEKRTANGFETHIFDTCASGRKIECELDKMLQAHATKACAVESISAREDEGERERENKPHQPRTQVLARDGHPPAPPLKSHTRLLKVPNP